MAATVGVMGGRETAATFMPWLRNGPLKKNRQLFQEWLKKRQLSKHCSVMPTWTWHVRNPGSCFLQVWCPFVSESSGHGVPLIFSIQDTLSYDVLEKMCNIAFATKLSLMVGHHKLECLVKEKMDCFGHSKGWKFLCLSGRYLLNCWILCNQTGYVDAVSQARVSCRKFALLSSSSRSQWGLIIIRYEFLAYLLNFDPFAV